MSDAPPPKVSPFTPLFFLLGMMLFLTILGKSEFFKVGSCIKFKDSPEAPTCVITKVEATEYVYECAGIPLKETKAAVQDQFDLVGCPKGLK